MLWPRRAFTRGSVVATVVITAACSSDDSTGLSKDAPPLTTPTTIVVSPAADTLGVGATRQITARATDAQGIERPVTITWRSANPNVASVASTGAVTALAPGLASIIASAGALADTATIFVRAQDLIVEPNAISIGVGEQVQLVASRPNGSAVGYGSTTTWTSSDPAIATVSSDGVVSAVSECDVTDTATADGKQGSALMAVHKQTIASIRIAPTTSSIYPGGTQQLSAVAYDDAGRQIAMDPANLKWSVSDTKIATVSGDGIEVGVAKGSAIVSARTGNKQATASVNVLASPAATVVVSLSTSTLEVGQTAQATAAVADANGVAISSPTIAWQSSNPAIATVNTTGLVTAVARGSVTISALTDGKTGSAPLTVAAKSVASVAVSPNPAAVLQGQQVQMTATAKDAQGTALPGKTFTWQSSNAAVATVSSSGMVTSVGPGTATITATADGVGGSAQFSTTQQPVANVAVTPGTASVTAGQDVQLTATATDANGNTLTGRVASWSSSNPTVATVSSSGKVTTIAKGTATITATIDSKAGSASIGVNSPPPAPVASVTVTLNAPSITVGQSTQAVAVLKDASGNVLSGRTIAWTSAATDLATVSSTGSVSAVAAGTVTISATSEGVTGNATLVIQPGAPAPVASVTLSATSTSMLVGQSQPVTVVLKDAQGNTLAGRTISWNSSNLGVVTVAPNGTVTAVGGGTATVTATSEGKSGSLAFTVTASTPVAPVASVTLSAPGTSLAVGQSMQVTATLKDGHGTLLTGRTITWSSSAPNVASVSGSGVVTGVAAGTAMITATSEGVTGSIAFSVTSSGSGTASVTVTLSSPALTVGQTTQAVAVAKDGSGNTLSGTPTWASSNNAVATVSSSGMVTAVSAGTANIAASVAGAQGAAPVSITTAGSGVTATLPELPRATASASVPAPTGRTIRVAAGGDLQAALNSALPGDVVALAPGATFVGGFVLPGKACTGWITLRTDVPDANLPASGQRITPSYAGQLAKLVTPDNQPALRTAIPTCQWRVFGIEITGTLPVTSVQYGLVGLGDGGWVGGGDKQTSLSVVPNDLVLDRVYIHGTPTLNTVRCLALNSGRTAVVNSYLSECHAKGFDSQAIEGWNGPGPYLIENNFLSGAGENVMFGGADPGIAGLSPSDITIRRNHVYKDPSWKGVWSVKNLFELKNARRVLVENNIFENNWVDGQSGMAIVIKSTTDVCGTACMWEGTTDVTFRYNLVQNSPRGFNAQAYDNSYVPTGTDVHVQRVRAEHNLFLNIGTFLGTGSDGWLTQLTHDLTDVALVHNTFIGNVTGGGLAVVMDYSGGAAKRIQLDENVFYGRGYYALFYSGIQVGTKSIQAFAGSSWSFARNVVANVDPEYAPWHPAESWYPTTVAAIGFQSDYSLGSSSPYKGKASGGTDPGADIAEIGRRTAGVVVP
jgi:uncharacterized protein YjdB